MAQLALFRTCVTVSTGMCQTWWRRCALLVREWGTLNQPSRVVFMCRINGESHVELPCNEIVGEEKERVASKMSAAARTWWQSLLAEPHSFEKPTFMLGLNGWSVTNILPDGAHERTPGRIELLPNGAAGFSRVGDSMCFSLNVSAGLQQQAL